MTFATLVTMENDFLTSTIQQGYERIDTAAKDQKVKQMQDRDMVNFGS